MNESLNLLCLLSRGVLQCGPGNISIHTAQRMGPYAAQTISEGGQSDGLSMGPQCVMDAFTVGLSPPVMESLLNLLGPLMFIGQRFKVK